MRCQTLRLAPLCALGACSEKAPDPRGVGHDETLLSVSATGRSETKPDEARFTAGVSTIAASAEAATQKNNETMTKVTEALKGNTGRRGRWGRGGRGLGGRGAGGRWAGGGGAGGRWAGG